MPVLSQALCPYFSHDSRLSMQAGGTSSLGANDVNFPLTVSLICGGDASLGEAHQLAFRCPSPTASDHGGFSIEYQAGWLGAINNRGLNVRR